MTLLCLRVNDWDFLRQGDSPDTGFDWTHWHEKEMRNNDFEKALVIALITGLPNNSS